MTKQQKSVIAEFTKKMVQDAADKGSSIKVKLKELVLDSEGNVELYKCKYNMIVNGITFAIQPTKTY